MNDELVDDRGDTSGQDLTIIALCSSAGGLEAIRDLVSSLPADLPVSYVVVQHMSPHHKSLMTELVARETQLTVRDAKDNLVPEPNVIYITPPNTDIVYKDGALRLVEPSPLLASPKPSVDRFLLSLADEHGEKSMAIILSGTGTDGAYGVQAIREAGGITIAQDTESAKYDGMPNAAVQTGCVDLILRPNFIGSHLQKILSSPRDFNEFRRGEIEQTPLSDLLQILLARTRVDFREYKQTTISRRIERRMLALGIDSKEEYTQFCRNNPQAVDALYKDLLISVTRFFRDRSEFDELNRLLIEMVERKKGAPIRVWIAGCATGEEAYSIAMMLSEALGGSGVQLKDHVQIFATDIDEDALRVARRGVYALFALSDIPNELADKYLIRENDGVRVIDSLRNAILFSHHNLCQDPPFQKIDLICCRNLLIYFRNSLQHKVMGRFHYSMSERSLMFLGTAESVAGSEELFVHDSSSARIFRKRMIRADGITPTARAKYVQRNTSMFVKPKSVDAGDSTDRKMFEALALSLGKNSLLVRDDHTIVRIFGNVSAYVDMNERSQLRMSLDLLRSPLREEARSLITIALKSGLQRNGVRHLLAREDRDEVRLEVYPIVASDINERAALVVFRANEVSPGLESPSAKLMVEGGQASQRIKALESEVATAREALQQTIEELETSNEELQSLNEEMQSTNEELQATNEELETSNEELQSTNEELITVNEELQVTASELSGRTGELVSILDSAPLPILVLDNALQVTQATSAAMTLFSLLRPLSCPHVSQCRLPVGYPTLAPICNETLKMGTTIEEEFASGDTIVKLITSPFFDERGAIQGVTMVISEFPRLAKEMEVILESSNFYMIHRERNGTILRISRCAATELGVTRESAVGMNFYDLVDEQSIIESRAVDDALFQGALDTPERVYRVMIRGTDNPFWIKTNRILCNFDDSEEPTLYSLGKEVTDLVMAQTHAQEAQTHAEEALHQLEVLQDLAGVGYWSVDWATKSVHWSDEVFRIHGRDIEDDAPDFEGMIANFHPDDQKAVRSAIELSMTEGSKFSFRARLVLADDTEKMVNCTGSAQIDDHQKPERSFGIFHPA